MIYKQTLSTNNITPGKNTCEYIILHHTGTTGKSIESVKRQLTTGPVSCHYIVDITGDIYKIGKDEDILRHAGESERGNKKMMNQYSIGIEIVGPLPGFTDEQRQSVKELVTWLMHEHKIPVANVIRHKDISPGRKVDVDDSFWNTKYPTFDAYKKQNFISLLDMIMNFYKKYWTDTYLQLPKEQKVFEKPMDAFDRIKVLPQDQQLEELIYLLAILAQKAK